MHHFFVEQDQISDKMVVIRGKDVNHIKNVLRMQIGEELSIRNGTDGREYRCEIESFGEEEISCRIRFTKEDGVELPSKIYLFQGLPKADKMELIIQKAVELGVYEIIPVATKRSVVKLDEKKAAQKTARWQSISEAAAKQSHRAVIPAVLKPMTFKEAVSYAEDKQIKLICYELAEEMEETRRRIEEVAPGQDIAVFIGPEGGFEETEVIKAEEAGVCPITMGKRILRTETAGLTLLSWLMYMLEGKNI